MSLTRTSFAIIVAAVLPCSSLAQALCTPENDLLGEWKLATATGDLGLRKGQPVDDAKVAKHVAELRATKWPSLSTRFYDIGTWSPEKRKDESEIVLWEDNQLMVLVDYGRMKALVIPTKRHIWVPTDADTELLRRLAFVAARTSDAFITATGGECTVNARSKIFIHPPNEVSMQQLHVHVQPPGITSRLPDDYWVRVEAALTRALGPGRKKG